MLLAHEMGLADLSSEFQCLANTLTEVIYRPPGLMSYGVDGSGISDRFEQAALGYDWLELHPWDPRINSLLAHQLFLYAKPDWHRAFAIWARVLRMDQER